MQINVSISRKSRMHAAAVAVMAALSAVAAAPDLTDSMEFLANPNASRWSDSLSRATMSIHPYNGKLYVSGGEWGDNSGPCPAFAVDPQTGAFVNESTLGTETVWYFREGSDGRLYVPGVDQCERVGKKNGRGAFFRRDLDGSWKSLLTVPAGNLADLKDDQGYAIHTWDLRCWKGKVFTAGYGIAYGPEGSDSTLTDATPSLTHSYHLYYYPSGQIGDSIYRRFYAFLPFEDDLFCIPSVLGNMDLNDKFEEWRFNESTGVFECTEVPWSAIAPGDDRGNGPDRLFSENYYRCVVLWHPTPFNGRVLYIVGTEKYRQCPWFLCSATVENHHVKATRINLGTGVYPFCITTHGRFVTVVAAKYDSATHKVVNSVWESDDGLSFHEAFSFKSAQQAGAIAHYGDSYYVGMGSGTYVTNSWPLVANDEPGKIYRIRHNFVLKPAELGNALAVVKDNGKKARLSVPLTMFDAPSVSLSLSFDGATVTNWSDVAESGTFAAFVDTEPGSSHTYAFTVTFPGFDPIVAEGSFTATTIDGWYHVDFADTGYKAGSAWTDETLVNNPTGKWTDREGISALVESNGVVARHVELADKTFSKSVEYTPKESSKPGTSFVAEGRVSVSAAAELPTIPSTAFAALTFLCVNGTVVPWGYLEGNWMEFSQPATPLNFGTWVKYELECDYSAPAAPRAQFRLDGIPLVHDGESWIALNGAKISLSKIGYMGTGGIGTMHGTADATVVAEFPIPVLGDAPGGEGGSNGGLSFGTNQSTGSKTFTATVVNPVAGAWYIAFTTTDLAEPFKAECIVQAQDGDEVIPLGVDATPASKFVKVVVSPTPFAAGDPLPAK